MVAVDEITERESMYSAYGLPSKWLALRSSVNSRKPWPVPPVTSKVKACEYVLSREICWKMLFGLSGMSILASVSTPKGPIGAQFADAVKINNVTASLIYRLRN